MIIFGVYSICNWCFDIGIAVCAVIRILFARFRLQKMFFFQNLLKQNAVEKCERVPTEVHAALRPSHPSKDTYHSNRRKQLNDPRPSFFSILSSLCSRFFAIRRLRFRHGLGNASNFHLPQSPIAPVIAVHAAIKVHWNNETQTQNAQIKHSQNSASLVTFNTALQESDQTNTFFSGNCTATQVHGWF